MFQVKTIPPAAMYSSVFTSRQHEQMDESTTDCAPRLPRRTRFEPNCDTAPRIPLRSFRTVDMGQLSRAPPKRGVSRCNSRVGATSLNRLHIPGQVSAANPSQDAQVFNALPFTESQRATILKFCINWWEM
ncbi:hypothetical protein MPSEU_000696600 [Mayamaea pseudoterrestris]|nr:hypothetical protein MPSEU_000696600 [Mayamaea pseudoterrestris]